MANLTSSLVISLRDQVSGPAGGVSKSLLNIQRAAESIARVSSKLNLGTKNLLNPLKDVGTDNLDETYYQWDQLAQQIAAISETGADGMMRLKDAIRRVSTESRTPPQDLMAAAKAWLELGNSLDTFEKIAAIAAKTSRITGVSPAQQMTGVNSILRAYGKDPNNIEDVSHFEELYLVASKGMVGGAHAFEEAMKTFAPVAKATGMTVEEAAALVQTLGGQFEAGEIGNALKTGFVRLLRPRSGALPQLRAAGIDYTKWFNFDIDKLQREGGLDFAERLRGMGRRVSPELAREINEAFETADLSEGAGPLQDKLTAILTDAYGHSTRKGKKVLDGQTTKDIAAAVAQHVQAYRDAMKGFNVAQFLDDLSKQVNNVPLLDSLFGVNRLPQFLDLLRQAGHFRDRLEKIIHDMPGAIDRKWKEFFDKADSYSNAVNRLTNAWDNLWKKMADTGVGSDIATIMNGVARAVEWLQSLDPVWSRMFFWMTTIGSAAAAIVAPLLLLAKLRKLFTVGKAAIGAGEAAAGGAAAGAGTAGVAVGGAAVAKRFGLKALARILGWPLALALAGYDAYEGYQKDGWKGAILNPLTFGFYSSGDEGAEPNAAQTAVAGGRAVASGKDAGLSEIQTQAQAIPAAVAGAMAQVRTILAGVDLTAEGRRAMQTYANGLAEGASAAAAAARAAGHQVGSAMRGAYSDGGR
ncbi:phage tail tape measure protein [Hyphomicrobium sp. NDB2Meth4]|uniref:phage tail tape measure protein n=1 Tax=Hyphomicrobium sp. NDB2Meth4 TaxID=1892846 RepID=UPI000931EA55|nr:phage tail tape measure protein [Hyphomicrobium sp. NDB2Meth4]